MTTDFGTPSDKAWGVAVQADGKIVAAGDQLQSNFPYRNQFALSRYNPDGTLDTTFSGDGKVTTLIGLLSGARAVTIQPADGKILAVGYADVKTTSQSSRDFAVVRYNPDGSLDTTFGPCANKKCTARTGYVTTDIGGGSTDQAVDVLLQGDGKFVVGGTGHSEPAGAAQNDFMLTRYNPNGSLDTTFGSGGKVRTNIAGEDAGRALAMQSDGKIVMAGGSDSGPGGASRFTLVRYNSSGSLDTSFGGAGVVTTGFETVENFAGAWDVAIQADGKIVAAGGVAAGTVGGPDGFALARDNLDGSLDTTFDGDGRQTLQFGYSYPGPVMAIQSNGQIVLAGQILAPDENLALARVNTDGSLDTNFGTGGTVTTNIPGEARAVALQADGKIVAVGVSGGDFVAARFCP